MSQKIVTAAQLATHLFNGGEFQLLRRYQPPGEQFTPVSFHELIAVINKLEGTHSCSNSNYVPTNPVMQAISKLPPELTGSRVMEKQIQRLVNAANELITAQQVFEQFQQSQNQHRIEEDLIAGSDLQAAEKTLLAVTEETSVLTLVLQVERSLNKLEQVRLLQLELLNEVKDTNATIHEWTQTNYTRTLKTRELFIKEVELKRSTLKPHQRWLNDFDRRHNGAVSEQSV